MLETAWMIERGRALPINGKASSKIGAAVPVGKIRPVLTLAGEPHHVVAALAAAAPVISAIFFSNLGTSVPSSRMNGAGPGTHRRTAR
jgi:hypothetical protein